MAQTTTATLDSEPLGGLDPLEAAAAAIRAKYQPTAITHEPEWTGKYLGVSTLVKQTAADYAKRIIGKDWKEFDEEMAYYNYRGNALGDRALEGFRFKEVCVEAPLRDGWVLRGHADAVEFNERGLVVAEHKSHSSPTPSKVDLAFRQGVSYLALIEKRLLGFESGEEAVRFQPASFAPNNPDLYVPAWTPCVGVVVAVAPFNPPAVIKEFPTSPSELQAVREFLFAKAESILAAVLTGDLATAEKWDADHPTEFLVPFGQIDDGIPELDDIGRELAEQLRILTPTGIDPEALYDAEAEVKRLKKLADLSMAKHEVKSGIYGGVRLSRVVVKGREVPAKPAGFAESFSYTKATLAV